MSRELNLRFPDLQHVIVSFDGEESGALPFTNPLTPRDREDIRWYVEVYGAHSLGDPDDAEAKRIATRLPELGRVLFTSVFSERAAERLFNRFQDQEEEARLLTISAEHPALLALPWELLHDSARGGAYLFQENPRVSIRRRVAGATGGRSPFQPQPKDRLHLLFVVSRPTGIGFIDPRADPQAVLDALEEHAPGRVECEFLHPPTLDALVKRLEHPDLPRVDVLHFDGHGAFDRHGGLPEALKEEKGSIRFLFGSEAAKARATAPTVASPPNTGYLLFEDEGGKADPVSAEKLVYCTQNNFTFV